MRESQILDDFNSGSSTKARILDENAVQINRYLFHFEDDETLFVKELPGKSHTPIFGAILFGVMGLFWLWALNGSYNQEGFTTSLYIMGGFCLFSFLLAFFLLWTKYWSKAAWEFGSDYLTITNIIGYKKTLKKNDFTSVFIQKNIQRTNGSVTDVSYVVAIKMKHPNWNRKQYDLMSPDNKNTVESFLGGSNYEVESIAEGECRRIIDLIAFHWEIPVGI